MRLHTLVLYTFLGLISSSKLFAQAQTYTLINGIKVEAVAVSSARIASNGEVLQGIQFRAQSGTTPPKFYERAVQFGKGTTGASIKNFAKGNAFQIGLSLGILGIGWAMDELTGQIYSTSPTTSTCGAGVACFNVFGGSYGGSHDSCTYDASQCMTSASQAPARVRARLNTLSYPAGRLPFTCNLYNPTTVQCIGSDGAHEYATVNSNTRSTIVTSTIPGTLATDTEIANQVIPQLAPSSLPKLHTDTNSGAVQKTQEVLNKATDVANQYARELNPESVNATAPTASPLPVFQEKSATDTLPSPSALSLPDFCTWASFLCDAPIEPTDSNWTVASMITEDEIELETYSSGLGSGSCPSPETFIVYGTSISYSYQPMCDLSAVVRIFVLIFAYLSSIYILLGIRK